jgi:hypothetical protein
MLCSLRRACVSSPNRCCRTTKTSGSFTNETLHKHSRPPLRLTFPPSASLCILCILTTHLLKAPPGSSCCLHWCRPQRWCSGHCRRRRHHCRACHRCYRCCSPCHHRGHPCCSPCHHRCHRRCCPCHYCCHCRGRRRHRHCHL